MESLVGTSSNDKAPNSFMEKTTIGEELFQSHYVEQGLVLSTSSALKVYIDMMNALSPFTKVSIS